MAIRLIKIKCYKLKFPIISSNESKLLLALQTSEKDVENFTTGQNTYSNFVMAYGGGIT